LDVVQTLE